MEQLWQWTLGVAFVLYIAICFGKIAEKHGKTSAQVILRWHLQNGVIVIPKSVHEARIKENADLFDFELTLEEMSEMNALNENERFGSHPDHFNF